MAQGVPEVVRPCSGSRKVSRSRTRHRKLSLLRVALSAMGMMLPACRNGADLSCSTDLDCLESELCHPDEKECVQLCTTSADCPETAKTCAVLSDTSRVKICKCLTQDCEEGTSP